MHCTGIAFKNNFPELYILPSVSNGIDLVASVQNNQPDIVIVDINMPGLNGLDALEMIRNHHPEMKIIIHSAYSEFEYAKGRYHSMFLIIWLSRYKSLLSLKQ